MSDKRVHIGKGIQRALDGSGNPLPDMFIVTDANGEQEYVDAAAVISLLGVIGGGPTSPDVLIDCGTILTPSPTDNVLIDCGTII